jgi:hypothetical protein
MQHTIQGSIVLIVLLLLIVSTNGSITIAQTGNSRIKGRTAVVTPDKRELLTGVPVKLEGKFLQGKSLETISDEEGNYQFNSLIAGDYILTVEFQGFEKFQEKVIVPLEAVVDLDVKLKPLELKETATITAPDTATAKTESSVPSTITARTLINAPLINERFQDALPLLPGVVRGPDGLLNLKGARASQSGILVSSLNVADPVTGNPAIELPIDAVEEIQVYSNPYLAEYGKFTGAVTSIETRAGTNDWRYLFINFTPRPRIRDGHIRGIESFAPRLSVGGPIVKDKLFLFQSLEYRYIRTPNYGLPERERDNRLESFDSFTRLDYNINSNNRLTVSFSVFPQKLDYYNLSVFNPLETTSNFHQRGWFFAINEQAVFKDTSLLQSSFSVKQFDADIYGNSDDPYVIVPERRLGGWFNRQHRESRRYEWLETYTLPQKSLAGTHNIKLGLNINHTTFNGNEVNRPVSIKRADRTLSQLITFTGTGQLDQSNNEYSAFIQDKWSINNRVTFDLGLRYDRDTIGKDNNLAPRFGFAILPFENGRTVLRGGVGLFYDKIPLNVGEFENYQDLIVTNFNNTGTVPITEPRQFHNVVEDNNFRNPYSVAWNLQADHEITSRVLIRLGYEERRTKRDFIIDPIVSSSTDNLLLLGNSGRSKYKEWQVMTRYRLQERNYLYLAYTRSRAEGDQNDFNSYFGNIRNPIIQPNEYSIQPFDAPNRLLFWGDIGLPSDITATPVVDWRTGFPYSLIDEEQNFVSARNRGGRYPRFFSLDLQVTKGLIIPLPFVKKKLKGRFGVKMFNITNHWNPREIQNNIDAADFGTFYNSVPRRFRLKFAFLKY